MEDSCLVYFIGDSYNHIKIGVTYDILRRVDQLATAHAEPLYLFGVIICPNQQCAYCLEHYFHNLFMIDRLNGEWFKEEPVRKWLCLNMYLLNGMDVDDVKTVPIKVRNSVDVRFSVYPEIDLQKLLFYGRLPKFVEEVQRNEYTKSWSWKLKYAKSFIPAPNKKRKVERDIGCVKVLESSLLSTKSEYRKSRKLV